MNKINTFKVIDLLKLYCNMLFTSYLLNFIFRWKDGQKICLKIHVKKQRFLLKEGSY